MKRDMPEQTYEWHFLTQQPPEFLNAPRFIEMFQQWVKELANAHGDFEQKLRQTALLAITADNPTLIRQALQCLAHVGTIDDLATLTALESHLDQLVCRDAKTCMYEIQHRRLS